MNEKPELQVKELSPHEWKVMKIVWEMGEGAARDISHIATSKFGMTHATVKVFLHRLIGKGFLFARTVGNSYLYQPTISMEDALREAADNILEETSEKAAETVMLHLVQNSRLTQEGYQRLRSLLDQHLQDREDLSK